MKIHSTVMFVSLLFLSCHITAAKAQIIKPQIESPFANWNPRLNVWSDSNPRPEPLATELRDPDTEQVVIEVTKILIDSKNHEIPIKSFFKTGTFEVHTGSLPPIQPESVFGSKQFNSVPESGDSSASIASSSKSVRRSMPVMTAKLDPAGVTNFKAAIKAESENIVQMPKTHAYLDQKATVNDVAQRPFVVGVKPIVSGDSVVHQPIIQTIEDGIVMQLKTSREDGHVVLTTDLAHSVVSKVDAFTFSGTSGNEVTIQIPEQTVTNISVVTSLADGETLFIDPRLQVEESQKEKSKLPFAKPKTHISTFQVYFLVSPRIIERASEIQLTKAD